ncbi:MAG: type II secretion system major pseudopilin GspG [Arenicellales bacterium]
MEMSQYMIQKDRKKQSGFTLIEIMVVVVIIGMLATMILPKVLGRQDEAFIAKAKSDIRAISSSVKLYKLDNFKYPSALSELVSGGAKGRGYLDKVPKDPWGKEYQYTSSGSHLDFDVWSMGADGTKQIGNWNMDEIR